MGKGSFQVKKPEKRNIFFLKYVPKLYKLSKTITYSKSTLYKPINLCFFVYITLCLFFYYSDLKIKIKYFILKLQ